eukprot:887436-Prymnesium_polylepis.1
MQLTPRVMRTSVWCIFLEIYRLTVRALYCFALAAARLYLSDPALDPATHSTAASAHQRPIIMYVHDNILILIYLSPCPMVYTQPP